MKKHLAWVSALSLIASGAAMAVPFEGLTAEELFPGAENELERSTAYSALINSNLPDARDRFAGQTVTVPQRYLRRRRPEPTRHGRGRRCRRFRSR